MLSLGTTEKTGGTSMARELLTFVEPHTFSQDLYSLSIHQILNSLGDNISWYSFPLARDGVCWFTVAVEFSYTEKLSCTETNMTSLFCKTETASLHWISLNYTWISLIRASLESSTEQWRCSIMDVNIGFIASEYLQSQAQLYDLLRSWCCPISTLLLP